MSNSQGEGTIKSWLKVILNHAGAGGSTEWKFAICPAEITLEVSAGGEVYVLRLLMRGFKWQFGNADIKKQEV